MTMRLFLAMTVTFLGTGALAAIPSDIDSSRKSLSQAQSNLVEESWQAISSGNVYAPAYVVKIVKASGNDPKVIATLVRRMSENGFKYQTALAEIGEAFPDVVLPILDDRWQNESDNKSDLSISVVGNIGMNHPSQAFPILFKAAKGENLRIQRQAISALIQSESSLVTDEQSKRITELLTDHLLHDPDGNFRRFCAQNLNVDNRLTQALPALRQSLFNKDEDSAVKALVILALNSAGVFDEEFKVVFEGLERQARMAAVAEDQADAIWYMFKLCKIVNGQEKTVRLAIELIGQSHSELVRRSSANFLSKYTTYLTPHRKALEDSYAKETDKFAKLYLKSALDALGK